MSEHVPVATILVACGGDASGAELRAILEAQGHHVIEAETADEAFRHLQKRDGVDLVIAGVRFGHAAQFSFARSIKAAPATATIPVMCVIPREREAADRAALLETGMDGYIVPPLEPRAVAASVNALLRLVRARVDLRATEEAGQRRLAELDAIYDTAPVGLCVLDTELRYVRINKRFAELNGRPAEDHIGRTVRDVIPHLADHAEPAMRRLLATGEPVLGIEITGETVAQPGVPRIWIENWHPLRDAAGQVVGINIVAEDVTERQRAEAALRASEERLRGLMEQAPFSVQVFAPDGRTVRVNRAWEDLWGVTLDQIADDYNVLEDAQLEAKGIAPYIRRAFAGDAVRIPAVQYDPNETLPDRTRHQDARRWVAAVAYPLKDLSGQVREVVVVHDDITDRKRAEEALSFLAEGSRALSEPLDVGAILSAIGRLAIPHLADWVLVETFGTDLSPEHLVVLHRDEAKAAQAREATRRYAPERNPAHPLARVIATGRAELLTEIPDSLLVAIARSPAHLAWLRSLNLKSAVVAPMVARGRTVGVLGLATAESGRRYGDRDRALADELARRAALAVDNARLYSELREEARRKDEFLAMLAHELRSPLAPILNAVTVLDRVSAQTPDDIKLRSIITRQTRHLSRLVDDLLDVARLVSGKVSLQREPVDLRDVVRRAVEALREAGRAQAHDITISVPADPAVVEGDPVRLDQIVGNLLDNAVKYTPAGRAIHVSVARDSRTGLIRVRDDGMGIEPHLLSRMFEPFVQAEQVAARPRGGLGLGLALVRALVEQHGGAVTAHSAGVGHGTEFVVRLPLTARVLESTAPPAARPRPLASTILLIEDNDDARAALKALLESEGHRVEAAADGEQGLNIAAAARPDVVIIDIGLPIMDGYEVARRLSASEATRSVYLIALTGYGQLEDRRRAEEAGFDAYLVKPVDVGELARVLAARPKSQRSLVSSG